MKVLHLSDLHLEENPIVEDKIRVYGNNLTETYDFVVISGDIVHRRAEERIPHLRFLEGLAVKESGRKLYTVGDHEYILPETLERLKPFMGEAGFLDIDNKKMSFAHNGKSINVYGLDDLTFGNPDYSITRDMDEERFNIVVAHNPDTFTSDIPPFVDLDLAGHLHGGAMYVEIGGKRIFDGYGALEAQGVYTNLNNVLSGFKFLTDRTLAHVSDGIHAYFAEFAPYIPFVRSARESASVITLRTAA